MSESMDNTGEKNPTLIDESRRRRFEEAWVAETPLPLAECLPDADAAEYRTTLEELVHIQLEFAWKAHAQGGERPADIEALLREFPVLDDEDVLLRLLRQEFHCRETAGDSPSVDDYQASFSSLDLGQLPTPPGETVGPAASEDTAAEVVAGPASGDQATLPPPAQAPVTPLADERTLAGPVPQTPPADEQTLAPPTTDSSSVHDDATLAGGMPGAASDVDNSSDTFNTGNEGGAVAVDLGKQVPGYELLGELGRGGMGVVYRALDTRLKRVVALKMILSGVHADEEDLKRFQREAEAVAQLQHPNIVQIHDVGEHDGQPFFSLEFVEGGGLDEKIGGEPQPPMEAAALVEQLARAVHFAHERNIVHRDLKPANVLLTAEGEPKITDFGLAKRLEDDSSQTASGSIMGTPSYMAPEQAGDEQATIGPQTDVYALGAILYCLLTGRPPFQSSSVMDTVMQVLEQDPVSPGQLVEGLDRNLETITLKCLQKSPDRRYQSAEDVAEELRRHQAGEPIQARPIGQVERVWRWCRRKPLIATLWGSVAALVMFVTINGYYEAQEQAFLAELATQSATGEKIKALEAKQSERQAVGARQAALKSETAARRAKTEILQQAIENNLWEGQRLFDSDFPARSYAKFARALELQSDSANVAGVHMTRMRLGSVLSRTPRPSRVWPLTTSTITHCGYSQDGKIIVAAEMNGVVRLWKSETGEPLCRPLEHDGYVSSVALSADNSKLAVGIIYESAGPKGFQATSTCRIWDLKTRKKTKVSLKHDEAAVATVVEFHPDGRRLVTVSDDMKAVIWDSQSGKPIHTLKHAGEVRWAAFLLDGGRIATVSRKDGCIVWDCATGQRVGKALQHDPYPVYKADVNTEGTRIATGSYGSTRIWNAETLQPITEQLPHGGSSDDIHFSPDGKMLLVASNDMAVRVWDATTGTRLLSPLQHGHDVEMVRASADGQRLVTACKDGAARVWSTEDGQLLMTLRHNKPVNWAMFDPNCRRVLTGSMIGGVLELTGADIHVWDLSIVQVAAENTMRHGAGLQTVAVSPDGTLVATGSYDQKVRLWSSTDGKPSGEALELGATVERLSFHAEGKVLFARGEGNVVRIWNVKTRKPVGKRIGRSGDVQDTVMSPDGAVIATLLKTGVVEQWDAVTGASLGQTASIRFAGALPSGSRDVQLCFSPRGRQLLAVETNYPLSGRISSWLVGTQQPASIQAYGLRPGLVVDGLEKMMALTGAPKQVVFSKDGMRCLILMGSLDLKKLWRSFELQVFETNPLKAVFKDPVMVGALSRDHMGFSPDGKLFLAALENQTVRVWDAETGKSVVRPLRHQQGSVEWAEFSPDGRLVVTCGSARDGMGAARVWDIQSGHAVTPRLLHPDDVRAAHFLPDGKRIVTRCDDGRVRIWRLQQDERPSQELQELASFLNGQGLAEVAGAEEFLEEATFHNIRNKLEKSTPELFKATRQQVVRWHLAEIEELDLLVDARRYLIHLNAMIVEYDQPALRYRRSEILTGLGQFDRALADYKELVKPGEVGAAMLVRAGLNALLANQAQLFRKYRDRLVKRSKDSQDLETLTGATGLLLVSSSEETDTQPVRDVLERAIEVGRTDGSNSVVVNILRGLAQVRSGQAGKAIKALGPMLAEQQGSGKKQAVAEMDASNRAMCHLVLSLASMKSDPKSAGSHRQKAEALIRTRKHSYSSWANWLYCDALTNELEQLRGDVKTDERKQ